MASQQSLRRALGAIKDSTSVSLAKVNSEFKELDVAIVKSTSHLEDPPKEKHVRTIFAATSAIRPRADVAYCIVALARRLAKTHNWAVALKTLLVIHRTLREGDPTFREELINYGHSRGQILNMSQFKDDSSPEAWELSAWVRSYALFLEERLECFRVLKYDVDTEKTARTKNLDTMDLLEQLPALQQLQYCLMGCQPEGSARFNRLVPCALNLVLKESIKLYQAISDGTINLVDKFFEMQRHDAVRAFDIYKKAGQQTERLSEFYEHCKSFDMSRNLKFPPLEQPPQSFISAMEEYVKEAPRQSTVRDISGNRDGGKIQLALEYKVSSESEATPAAVIAPPAAPESSFPAKPTPIPSNNNVDLLGLNEPIPDPSVLDESNALALAIVTTGPTTNGSAQDTSRSLDLAAATTTGWELALVETQSSNNNALVESKLAGGFDRMTLDSLYDDGLTRPTYAGQATYGVSLTPNPHESPAILQAAHHDPFFASSKIAPPPSVQMAALQQQQQFMMMQQQQQQQQMMGMQPSMNISNPFGQATYGMPYAYTPGLQPQPQPQLQLQLHGQHQNNNPFGSTGLL